MARQLLVITSQLFPMEYLGDWNEALRRKVYRDFQFPGGERLKVAQKSRPKICRPECPTCGNKLSYVRSFIILRLGEGLIFFNKDNRANFFGEKNYSEAFQRVYILRTREKNFKSGISGAMTLISDDITSGERRQFQSSNKRELKSNLTALNRKRRCYKQDCR